MNNIIIHDIMSCHLSHITCMFKKSNLDNDLCEVILTRKICVFLSFIIVRHIMYYALIFFISKDISLHTPMFFHQSMLSYICSKIWYASMNDSYIIACLWLCLTCYITKFCSIIGFIYISCCKPKSTKIFFCNFRSDSLRQILSIKIKSRSYLKG